MYEQLHNWEDLLLQSSVDNLISGRSSASPPSLVFADRYIEAVRRASCLGLGGVLCLEGMKVGVPNRDDRLEFPEDGCLGLQCSSGLNDHCGNDRKTVEVAVHISIHIWDSCRAHKPLCSGNG
jgi:hypothetical protein